MISRVATWTARLAGKVIPAVTCRIPVSSKIVFLTFDDGPSHSTSDLLDLLLEHEARATFFLQGSSIGRYEASALRILRDGHGIGNHSFDHLDAWRNRWVNIREDLERGSECIASLTGATPRWMRPPYGRFHSGTLAWCRASGQRLVLWDVMAGDFGRQAAPDQVAEHVMALMRPGSILVLHDGDAHQPRSLAITARVLSMFGESGWTFAQLPPNTEPGSKA